MAEQRRDQLIRAFIAVDPGDNGLPAATSVIRQLRSGPLGRHVRWVRPENLHVTLRFLGNIESQAVDRLLQEVRDAVSAVRPFGLSLGRTTLFPSPRRPRVVAVDLLPEEPLIRLAAAVEQGVREAGFPGEDRSFRAHLTLGRIKRNAPRRLEPNLESPNRSEPDRVERVTLYRSELRPDGPVYSVLGEAVLGGD